MDSTIKDSLAYPIDKEISLRRLTHFILKKRRIVLYVFLVFIIFGLLISGLPLILKLTNEDFMNAYRISLNQKVSDYTSELERRENEIEEINGYILKQKSYYDQSVLAGAEETMASDLPAGYDLTEISNIDSISSELEVARQQQSIIEYVYTLNNRLKTKQAELLKMQNEGEPQWEYAWGTIAVRLAKNAVIAGVLGLLASILSITIFYIASDKILDMDKLHSLSVVDILGVVPRKNPKRMKLPDRVAGRLGGMNRQPMDYPAALAVAAQSIYAAALAKGIKDGGVALAGSIGADALREFAEALNGAVADSRLRFVAAGDPLREAAAMEPITAAEFTVIVEKQGVSVCSDVVKETERIRIWGKPVLGAVLLDADAI